MSDAPTPSDTPKPDAKAEPKEELVTTRHAIKVAGRTLKYTATCGTVVLHEDREKDGVNDGRKPRATIFFVAYTLDGAGDRARRPLTFSFNGGPGSSSVWLHMGLAGPKRVAAIDDFGNAGPPPFALVDNAHTLLTESDLVFIDPVGTGFSRMAEGEKNNEFHNYQRDLDSVGEFIRLYTARNQRWASPKYIIGESYGTTRAAGLAGLLQERHGMYLNGLMLVSCALDFTTLRFDPGNDLPPVLYLPTYAATAWYHKRLAPDLQRKPLAKLIGEVEAFAGGDYAAALFKGHALPAADAARITETVSKYTGLSTDYVRSTRMRVEILRFCKQLLRDQGRSVGRLDSRFTSVERDSAGEVFEFDAAYAGILGPYSTQFNDYVRGSLGYARDMPYHTLSSLYMNWGWGEFNNRYVNVTDTLRKAMTLNPHLQVFVANGYYDFATPHFASDYSFNHLAVEPARRAGIKVRYYEAGHMMYVHQPSLVALAGELREFVRGR